MTGGDKGREALLARWAERAVGYPLAPERLPLIAADLDRFSEALAVAGTPALEVEPAVDYRRRLIAGRGP